MKTLAALLVLAIFSSAFTQAAVGTLRVEGVPLPSQNKEFSAASCNIDQSGRPLKFGCGGDLAKFHSYPLNVDVSVEAGLYLLYYADGNKMFVKINPGQQAVVKLQKVTFPTGMNTNNFWVFLDLTNQAMLNMQLIQIFTNGQVLSSLNYHGYCQAPKMKPEDRPACAALLQGKSPRDLLGPYLRVDSSGFINFWNFERHEFNLPNYQNPCVELRCFAQQPANSYALSLPGVYGILYPNGQTGNFIFKRGIPSHP